MTWKISIAALTAGLLALVPSHALACGLDSLPNAVHSHEHSDHATHVVVPSKVQVTSLDTLPAQGTALVTLTGVHYEVRPGMQIGAQAGWAHLMVSTETRQGWTNPTLFSHFNLLDNPTWETSVGMQLEIPAGGDSSFAASHFEFLPYAQLNSRHGRHHLGVQVGGRFVVDPRSHAHAHSHSDSAHPDHNAAPFSSGALLLNPHQGQELIYLLSARRSFGEQAFGTTATLAGQTVLDGEESGKTFLAGGVEFSVPLTHEVLLTLGASVPLGSNRRFAWRTSAGATLRL